MKTAVQTLLDDLANGKIIDTLSNREKYLELEKNQIVDAVNKTYDATTFEKDGDGYLSCPFDGEDYYNQTYNQ